MHKNIFEEEIYFLDPFLINLEKYAPANFLAYILHW